MDVRIFYHLTFNPELHVPWWELLLYGDPAIQKIMAQTIDKHTVYTDGSVHRIQERHVIIISVKYTDQLLKLQNRTFNSFHFLCVHAHNIIDRFV